nr:reverse transcriptase domain-containing protein [Tanacetum cinerariifolium]
LNHDSSIISYYLKIDSLLDEFVGEVTLLKSIPLGINKTDCYHENEIHFIERLLYDNSSPHPPEEFVSKSSNANIESFSHSPILVEDSDSFMKEIDLTSNPDDPMPPSIEEDDNESERDILILEELPSNYSLSLPVNESFHFDIPSFLVLLQNHHMDLLSGIPSLLAVGTTFTGSGNLYYQWELSPGSGNALVHSWSSGSGLYILLSFTHNSISLSLDDGLMLSAFTSCSGTLPRNTIANPRSDLKSKSPILTSKPVNSPIIEHVASPVSASRPNQRPSIPYPSRLHDQKLHDKANDQHEKFFQIFKDFNFNISFADALIQMPKFCPSIKCFLTNKDKLCELVRTSLNEHCSAVLLKKLPEKLGDPGKFLIPYLPDLTPMCMTLELADRLISRPVRVAEVLYVKVGTFYFSADFVVVDFDVDPRVPLILEISFLKIKKALIDVFEGKLTLRVDKEAITFNLDQTSRYSANYNDMTTKRIDVIDMACEKYSQKVLGFYNVIVSGNSTPYYDPIVSTTSLTLTLFRNSDFLLEEVDAFLARKDNPTLLEVDQSYLDSEGDILLLESFLNDDPSLPLQIKEIICLKIVEHKDLPPHIEYTFLEGDDKLSVIIAKDLSVEVKTALITVLNSHKRAIAWKLSDIKVIDTKGAENLAADHLSRLENPHQNVLDPKEINESFPLETLNLVSTRVNSSTLSPYKLVYGKVCHLSIKLEHKAYWALKHANFDLQTAGDHRKVQLSELNELRDQAYENSLIYKEKTTRLHDSKIKDRVFNIGDRVILFNSRLKIFSGKLKSRWSGPFTISHVYLYSTVELAQPDGPNFKVNGHRPKHYFGEDVSKMVFSDL